jgi:hypothetical protein
MWSCNCKICNGGKGCPTKVTRAAMLRKKIPPWCLGSYIGKDKPAADLGRLLKIAQVADDLINCCPVLSAADMVMLLADARGDEIPGDYKGCAKFAKDLGMSHGNAYNVAEKWTRGSGSRPADSQVPPQTGGGVNDSSRTTAKRNRVKPAGREPSNRPEVGFDPSKSWTESALGDDPDRPTFGQRTLDDKSNRRPAA